MYMLAGSHEVPTNRQHVASWTFPCHQILAEAMVKLHYYNILLCDGRLRLGRCEL